MPDYKPVPHRIKSLCYDAGQQMQDLQEASGIARTTFYSRMREPKKLELEELVHISKVLHVPLEKILEGVKT